MIKIVAKAANDVAVLDKKNKGADLIEWQLISSCNVDVGTLYLPIVNVHSRLFNGEDICLDKAYNDYLGIFEDKNISDSNNSYVYLIEALELGNWLGEQQGFRVNIITHLYYGEFVQKPEMMAEWLKELLNQYIYCNILVENSCALNKNIRFRNMFLPNIVPNFIEELRNHLGDKYKKRIGSVLDICHMLSSIRIGRHIFKIEGLNDKIKSEDEYIEEYMKLYSNSCMTVHFNNSTNYGINSLHHGTIFETEEDLVLFDKLINYYMKYLSKAKFVLEVREDDLNNAVNFERMASLVRDWEKKQV